MARRLLRAALFVCIFPASTSSELRQMGVVSLRSLPLPRMVSLRKRPGFSVVAGLSVATELSSFEASSMTSRSGGFLGRKIAVDVSSGPGWGGAPLGSALSMKIIAGEFFSSLLSSSSIAFRFLLQISLSRARVVSRACFGLSFGAFR